MAEEILPLIDFSKVKKKRRQEEPDNEDQDTQDLDDFLSVKKNKGKKKKKKQEKNEINNQEIENGDPNNTNGAYSYEFLLKRLYDTMKEQKKNSGIEIKIPNVVLGVGGNSRTNWSNFGKMADALRRDREHFIKYVTSDLSVEASLGTEDQLYLKSKQRITEAMLKNVVQKYCDAFVKCPNCNSYKTLLKKDQSTRLPQIYCEVCKGTKTIQNIKSRGGGGGKKK
jgi:translation initiation factor 2 beta subunit (eIF-2beta)/eIF-5